MSNARMYRLIALTIVSGAMAMAQIPQVTGVLNSASWTAVVAPGGLASVFGSNLANGSAPPSVTINGTSAPLLYVSPGQINLQVPSSLGELGSNTIDTALLVVTTSAGSSNPAQIAISANLPALFTADGSGCGQAAAQVIHPDGATSLNSNANSAAPGDYIALYGTGFDVSTVPGLWLNETLTPSVLYSGVAPGLTGVDQINFQIPPGTRNGCAVPLIASQTLGSQEVTLSVMAGRGQCIDPPMASYGQINFSQSVRYGPVNPPVSTSDSFFATFLAGPAIHPPAPEQLVFAPDYVANGGASAHLISAMVPPGLPLVSSCVAPGYSTPSVGDISIQPPAPGISVTIQPTTSAGSTFYSFALPVEFLGAGAYTISGTGFTDTLNVAVPIQLQSSFPSGTTISSSQPLNVSWTGGSPGSLVRVALISQVGNNDSVEDYTYAQATAGSLTIDPVCSGNPTPAGNGVFCSFGLPLSSNAQIQIELLPDSATVPPITVPGITGPVQLNWSYTWDFQGLTLGP